ncbi:LysM peptidoglycan-binding domain-containing protein [uncultured Lentilactobacillus sp.]|uniref:aggregation-promoting factor n=1 Tax=uncultured Lentilactobacillus sp. TaxID=2805375 RepID=UPI0025998E96|nr:LysM peptidoglycan-binding domain-containing protein [uncultured Lentilactobacillus sp.]
MKFTKKAIKLTAAIAGAMALGTAATVTTANADTIYTVQSGDTLSGISYKYAHNLNMVDSLAANNKIANKNLIYVGQKLVIKDDGEIKPATAQQVATLPAANQTTNNNQAQQSAPVAKTTTPAQQSAPVANNQPAAAAPAATSNYASYTSNVAGNDAAAKAWIAARESGGNYGARNGQYVGKYQLSASYLNGDYSAANQERVADQYVASRYGSWSGAQAFWQSHGWY